MDSHPRSHVSGIPSLQSGTPSLSPRSPRGDALLSPRGGAPLMSPRPSDPVSSQALRVSPIIGIHSSPLARDVPREHLPSSSAQTTDGDAVSAPAHDGDAVSAPFQASRTLTSSTGPGSVHVVTNAPVVDFSLRNPLGPPTSDWGADVETASDCCPAVVLSSRLPSAKHKQEGDAAPLPVSWAGQSEGSTTVRSELPSARTELETARSLWSSLKSPRSECASAPVSVSAAASAPLRPTTTPWSNLASPFEPIAEEDFAETADDWAVSVSQLPAVAPSPPSLSVLSVAPPLQAHSMPVAPTAGQRRMQQPPPLTEILPRAEPFHVSPCDRPPSLSRGSARPPSLSLGAARPPSLSLGAARLPSRPEPPVLRSIHDRPFTLPTHNYPTHSGGTGDALFFAPAASLSLHGPHTAPAVRHQLVLSPQTDALLSPRATHALVSAVSAQPVAYASNGDGVSAHSAALDYGTRRVMAATLSPRALSPGSQTQQPARPPPAGSIFSAQPKKPRIVPGEPSHFGAMSSVSTAASHPWFRRLPPSVLSRPAGVSVSSLHLPPRERPIRPATGLSLSPAENPSRGNAVSRERNASAVELSSVAPSRLIWHTPEALETASPQPRGVSGEKRPRAKSVTSPPRRPPRGGDTESVQTLILSRSSSAVAGWRVVSPPQERRRHSVAATRDARPSTWTRLSALLRCDRPSLKENRDCC
eukprot:Gregarina_sp_Pseudo_9__308@NODE_11_length_6581_cov_205_655304_g9_i0_p1_GENE_NODE_11_length_6581_cov_205_655304_g9_i0NODE_11_length_6581_cov_205_655304_g9_i0_p1_ORF_typecomplete_len702_score237_05_NODE_11_length_6581_cov_205_655304_g9_i026744779